MTGDVTKTGTSRDTLHAKTTGHRDEAEEPTTSAVPPAAATGTNVTTVDEGTTRDPSARHIQRARPDRKETVALRRDPVGCEKTTHGPPGADRKEGHADVTAR